MKSSSPSSDTSERYRDHNLLKVDGLGCLLIWQHERIVIAGPDSKESDVTIQSSDVSPLSIVREGEHYFAESESPFKVNGQPATSKLLFSGDSLQIGSRSRLRFSRPVAASSTAVLRPTAAGFARGDIRHLVLMDHSLLFGAQGSHFPLESVDSLILLSLIEQQFQIRSMGKGLDESASTKEVVTLELNRPQLFEGLNFALSQDDANARTQSHAKI